MVCLDTNIFIYLSEGKVGHEALRDQSFAYSPIAKVEALGYSEITSRDERLIRGLLRSMLELPISDGVVECAIGLRQLGRVRLGDAIIAATAMENDAVLWTANTRDFKGIEGLKLYNPLA